MVEPGGIGVRDSSSGCCFALLLWLVVASVHDGNSKHEGGHIWKAFVVGRERQRPVKH